MSDCSRPAGLASDARAARGLHAGAGERRGEGGVEQADGTEGEGDGGQAVTERTEGGSHRHGAHGGPTSRRLRHDVMRRRRRRQGVRGIRGRTARHGHAMGPLAVRPPDVLSEAAAAAAWARASRVYINGQSSPTTALLGQLERSPDCKSKQHQQRRLRRRTPGRFSHPAGVDGRSLLQSGSFSTVA